MGHSFGGLFTQALLSRGLGIASVGVSPAAPSGVIALPLYEVKATFVILGNPPTFNKAVHITEEDFHYNSGNHLSKEESRVLWEKYSVPAAAHVLWQVYELLLLDRQIPLETGSRGVYTEIWATGR